MAESLTPNMEMYLKTIYELDASGQDARVKAIADRLGVRMPSVTGAVDSLQEKGLVEHEPYGAIRLTARGRRIAREVKARNDLIHRFLRDVLKLPEGIAAHDACVLEHVLSPRTVDRISAFLRFTTQCHHGGSDLIAHFERWLADGAADGPCPACEGTGSRRRCR